MNMLILFGTLLFVIMGCFLSVLAYKAEGRKVAQSAREAILKEGLEQIASIPCIYGVLGRGTPDDCSCASCMAKKTLSNAGVSDD